MLRLRLYRRTAIGCVERVFSLGRFQKLCKPGSSGAPIGRKLAYACYETLELVNNRAGYVPFDQLASESAARAPVVEAFPTAAMAVLADPALLPLAGRGEKTDQYFEYLVESQNSPIGGVALAHELRTVRNHDQRMAVICATVAAWYVLGEYTAIGDAVEGYFLMPALANWHPKWREELQLSLARTPGAACVAGGRDTNEGNALLAVPTFDQAPIVPAVGDSIGPAHPRQNQDAELREAVREYTVAALGSLLDDGFVLEAESEGGWRARGQMFAFCEYRGTPQSLHEAIAAQHARPEYRAAVQAFRAHPIIGPRIGKVVGTAFSRTIVQEEGLPDRLVYRFLRRGSFDATEFDAGFEELVESLAFETAPWVVIAPLSGMAANATPIELEPGVEIVEMTDNEVIACLSTGLITGFGMTGFVSVGNRIAIRLSERWPAVVGDGNDDDLRSATDAYSRRVELVEAVVQVLRLLKDGEVSVPGTVAFSLRGFEGRGYSFGYSPAPRHTEVERYRLEHTETDELVALWRDVGNPRVQSKRFLTTAIRRFGFAGERPRPEDRILDLMIAAEALFTPGTQTEVSHKVALHAAAFVSREDATVADVFKTMKQAYNARSAIAHGGEPEIGQLATGEDGTLDRLVALVAEHMREALKGMITLAVSGNAIADQAAWNALVLNKLRRP